MHGTYQGIEGREGTEKENHLHQLLRRESESFSLLLVF
jgi:hypothetical protein